MSFLCSVATKLPRQHGAKSSIILLLRWRVRCLGFERRTQQPVPFQSLNEIVRIGDGFGNSTQQVRVRLDLRVQVAGDVGEIDEQRVRFVSVFSSKEFTFVSAV